MKYFTLFIFIFCTGFVIGQTPNWVDANNRTSAYPTSSYLMGFAEQTDVSKKESVIALQDLESITKSKLIESVKVDVKSVSTSDVSDYNGEINDYFNHKTTTHSNLQLIGLQMETYYDKKSKTAYAISYVNKMKMAEYYRSVISKNMSDISNIISNGNTLLDDAKIKQAYKNGLQAYDMFFEIDESQKILLVIGAKNSLDTRIDEVNELNNDFIQFMNKVTSHRQMNMDDLGFIIANGLMKARPSAKAEVGVGALTYAQTGMSSEFGFKLNESIQQSLSFTQTTTGYVIEGNYYFEGGNLIVKTKLVDVNSKRNYGRNTVQIPEANLIHNNIVVIPRDIEKLKTIEKLVFRAKTFGITGKAGLGLNKNLEVYVSKDGKPISGIPVFFVNNNGGNYYCTTITGENGKAKCHVNKISGEYKNQVIKAVLDIENYLDNSSSEFVQNQIKNKPLPSVAFKVTVQPSTIYVEADENNLGKELDVKLIEPQLKESLAGYGFVFKDNEDNVDYIIKIKASSRKGGNVRGVFFAYADVTISVYDVNQGKEIYKDSLNNLKGGGGTFEQASGKAYYAASNQVKEKIVDIMVK